MAYPPQNSIFENQNVCSGKAREDNGIWANKKIKRFFPEGAFVMYTYSSIKALVMHLPCVPKVFFLAFGRMLGVGRRLTDLRPMVLARISRLTESEITNEKSLASRVVVSRSYIFGLHSDVIEYVWCSQARSVTFGAERQLRILIVRCHLTSKYWVNYSLID